MSEALRHAAVGLAIAGLAIGLTGCSSSGAKKTSPEARPTTSSAPGTSIRPGIYAVTGKPVLDHCDDALVFAASRLQIDEDGEALRALFEGTPTRRYRIEERGAELVAKGQFDPLPSCGTHQYVEVWRLRAAGANAFEGQLTAYYRDHRSHADCLRACKVVMAIKGTRVP